MTMIQHSPDKLTRFDFRIEPSRKKVVEQAAALLGMSLTQFADTALFDRAEEVIQQHTVTVLSDRDRDMFLAALDRDEKPNAALRKAAREYKRYRNHR